MEIGEFFKIASRSYDHNIFKVVENSQDSCSGCIAFQKQGLCNKMPDCGVAAMGTRIKFAKASRSEFKKLIKDNTKINTII